MEPGNTSISVPQSSVSNLLISLVLLLATFLRFYHLDASSLWNDEGNSWAMLSRSFGEIAAAAALDIHPPGYYWLLKLWSMPFGTSAASMRGLSAVLGVLLVALIAGCAAQATRRHTAWRAFPVLAALLAAVSPFQVYYSQEARMYMLLAVEAAGLFWALLWMMVDGEWRVENERSGGARALATRHAPVARSLNSLIPPSLFVLFGIAGMWTHYSFPIVLAAAGSVFVIWWAVACRKAPRSLAILFRFVGLNLLILLAFLPWLPTAVDRVLNWPKGGVQVETVEGLVLALRTLLFGPLVHAPDPLWPWLVAAGILPVAGLVALRRLPNAALAFGLWLFLPVAMMFGLGLFSDAFLKFLLVASPAWVLLTAAAPWIVLPASGWARAPIGHVLLWGGVAGFGIGAALASLPAYYADTQARDNYQGIARYLAAVGDPGRDLVVLDAPGQQEVWRYYDPGLPVLALPAQRPAERRDLEETLAAATSGRDRVFALFWATDEADPEQVVERWLDANAFKAVENWQGNLRFVTYELANELTSTAGSPVRWENGMVLEAIEQRAPVPQRVTPGSAAIVRLHWLAESALDARYKVSVQLLDARNHVLAQHDGEPGGGARPTDTWVPGERVVDNHGVTIPFGTPPGLYRLIAVVYDEGTSARVRQSGQDMILLGEVSVERMNAPQPLDVIPMEHRLDAALGPVRLVGYDAYRSGFAHAPETPAQPGDTIHFTLYWQAPAPLPEDWPVELSMTLRLGDQEIHAPLAGGAYPTAEWSAGELVRAEFELPYDGKSARPLLIVDELSQELAAIEVE